jgi:hypothetical protein
MAEVNPIHYALVVQECPTEPENVDLIRRYCPTLAVHTHEQVAKHVHVDEHGCWPWDGSRTDQGYGVVSTGTSREERNTFPTHRYMYETLVGPLPYGYYVHHRCEYKPCWHPLHLEAMTPREHLERHGLIPLRHC